MGESGENEDEWVKNFRELLDENEIHWTFYHTRKWIIHNWYNEF